MIYISDCCGEVAIKEPIINSFSDDDTDYVFICTECKQECLPELETEEGEVEEEIEIEVKKE